MARGPFAAPDSGPGWLMGGVLLAVLAGIGFAFWLAGVVGG